MSSIDDTKVNKTETSEFGYGQILAIFVRHRLLFIGILLITVACFIATSLRKPATYMSSMQLLIEPNYPSGLDTLIETTGVSSSQSQQDYATQLNLMRSNLFISKLIKNLKSEYPHISSNEIQSSLTIEKVVEGKDPTKIIKVTFIGDSPQKTQNILTALQALYQNYNRNQQTLKLTEGLRFIDNQLEVSRRKISQVQNKIENYRRKNSIFDPLQQVIVVNNAMNQVDQDIRTLQTQRRETQARYNTVEQQLNISSRNRLNISRLSQSELYQKQLAGIKETEQELARQKSVVTDDNPIIENLIERRQKQISLLKSEAAEILGSSANEIISSSDNLFQNGQLSQVDQTSVQNLSELKVTLVSFDAREKKLLTSKQQLRTQLNQFPSLIAEYQRLQPEVELGQSVLKKLLEQRQEISSRLSRGGFTWQVVESPLEGNKIGPDRKKDVLLGIVVGLFLASGAVFLRENLTKHNLLHQEESLDSQFPNLPLLGCLPEIIYTDSSKYSLPEEAFNKLAFFQKLDSSEFRNAIDLIYKNIQLYNFNNLIKSIMITSPFSGEGKTTLTLALALRMARANLRVLILDTNFENSDFLNLFKVTVNSTPFDLLISKTSEPKPKEINFLDSKIEIVFSESFPKKIRNSNFLRSHKMQKLIKSFSLNYDFILIDTSSNSNIACMAQLSSICDASILISKLDKLAQFQFNNLTANINKSNILGFVNNKNESSFVFDESKNKDYLDENQSNLIHQIAS